MAEAWDTTLVSRLRETGVEIDYLNERLAAGDPVAITSTSILEVAYGFRREADAGNRSFVRLLAWLKRFVEAGPAELLPLTPRAALFAGEIRARRRTAPPARTRRRTEGRSRAEARAAWILDIQIAATAWTAGREIVTADTDHFSAIANVIAELAPGGPRLRVLTPPV